MVLYGTVRTGTKRYKTTVGGNLRYDVEYLLMYCPVSDSFGAHERRYLSGELQPLLETLGESVPQGRGQRAGMLFTRRLEEVGAVKGDIL